METPAPESLRLAVPAYLGQPNKGIEEGGVDGGFPKKMEDDVDVYDLVPSGAVMLKQINPKSLFKVERVVWNAYNYFGEVHSASL